MEAMISGSMGSTGNAVIDVHPDRASLVTLNGFSRHRHTHLPMFGEIAASLASEEKVEGDLSFFKSPQRSPFSAIASDAIALSA